MLTCFSIYLQKDEFPAEYIFIAMTALYITIFFKLPDNHHGGLYTLQSDITRSQK